MTIVVDTPDRHNWLTRLVDLVGFCDRANRRFRDSLLGMYLLDLRRSRRRRKERKSR